MLVERSSKVPPEVSRYGDLLPVAELSPVLSLTTTSLERPPDSIATPSVTSPADSSTEYSTSSNPICTPVNVSYWDKTCEIL